MRLYSVALAVLILLLAASPGWARGQAPPDTAALSPSMQAFAADLDSLRQAHRIPGLAVAVVRDQSVAWSAGYGSSHFDTDDGEEYVSVTPDTPFWIASVTKPFLGLLFLKLDGEAPVRLEDRINDVPGWDGFCSWLTGSEIIFGQDLRCGASITIRNILRHRVQGTPGTDFSYNPIMYSRLSRYVEHAYGNPPHAAEGQHNTMAQLVEEHILTPAGMTRTMASQWQREKATVFFDMAQGYEAEKGGYVEQNRPGRHLAGGAGIVSTTHDLARFDIALDGGELAPKAIMDTLFSPPDLPNGTTSPYAYGWYVQDYRGERLVWHAGWDEKAGFSALYLKVPGRDLTLVLLANSEGLWWGNPLDQAAVHESPFAQAFLERLVLEGEGAR